MRHFALLAALAAAASVPAPAGAQGAGPRGTGATLAAEMLGSVRMALLRKCGGDPLCLGYAPRTWRGVESVMLVESLRCVETRRRPTRVRRCSMTVKSPRGTRLSCSGRFYDVSGDPAMPWTDRQPEKPGRVYLPTGRQIVPRMTLGASTLGCSGSLLELTR